MSAYEPIAIERDDAPDDLPRWVFLHSLRTTLGRPRLWLSVAAMFALLALAPALTTFAWFDGALAHRYEPGSVVHALDETFRLDQREGRALLNASNGALGSVLALFAMLLGAFTAGGWLQVFLERTEGHSVRRFFWGAARHFLRFVRVLVVTLLSLQLLGWLVYGTPWQWLVHEKLLGLATGELQELGSEWSARKVGFAQDGLYALGFALVLVCADYTRTRLAINDARSAVWAALCSLTLVVRHPIKTLRPLFFIWVLEAGALFLIGLLAAKWNDELGAQSTRFDVLALLLLGLAALAWRSATRGARYAACVSVSKSLVRPLSRPDPWKRSAGGPGGPRYPIDVTDGDEYGLSL